MNKVAFLGSVAVVGFTLGFCLENGRIAAQSIQKSRKKKRMSKLSVIK